MSSPEKFKMNDGDWVCSDSQCGNVNFARRGSCNRCGKEKALIPQRKILGHEIGKAAAEKSRGLFSADDWQCGRCGNVNWARRQTCNMCNAPKFGEIEERTGLGGGYNERENVEYVDREESDGEYDEFGRKKKKYRGNEEKNNKPKSPTKEDKPSEVAKISAEDEEEEDDDDDEDGDLSKYDLTGWGDDEEDNKDETKSRSHSSSSSSSRSSSISSRSSSSSQGSKSKRRASRSRSSSLDKKRQRKESSSSSRSRSNSREKSSSPATRKK